VTRAFVMGIVSGVMLVAVVVVVWTVVAALRAPDPQPTHTCDPAPPDPDGEPVTLIVQPGADEDAGWRIERRPTSGDTA